MTTDMQGSVWRFPLIEGFVSLTLALPPPGNPSTSSSSIASKEICLPKKEEESNTTQIPYKDKSKIQIYNSRTGQGVKKETHLRLPFGHRQLEGHTRLVLVHTHQRHTASFLCLFSTVSFQISTQSVGCTGLLVLVHSAAHFSSHFGYLRLTW